MGTLSGWSSLVLGVAFSSFVSGASFSSAETGSFTTTCDDDDDADDDDADDDDAFAGASFVASSLNSNFSCNSCMRKIEHKILLVMDTQLHLAVLFGVPVHPSVDHIYAFFHTIRYVSITYCCTVI